MNVTNATLTEQYELLMNTAEEFFHLGDRLAMYDALGVVAEFYAAAHPEEAPDSFGLAVLGLERRLLMDKGIEVDL